MGRFEYVIIKLREIFGVLVLNKEIEVKRRGYNFSELVGLGLDFGFLFFIVLLYWSIFMV